MRLNLLLLMAVSWSPFPTRFMAEAMRNSDSERAAVILYGASLLVIGVMIRAIWGTVALNRSLLKPEVTDAEITSIVRNSTPNVGFYAGLTALAIPAPHAAAVATWWSPSSRSSARAATAS